MKPIRLIFPLLLALAMVSACEVQEYNAGDDAAAVESHNTVELTEANFDSVVAENDVVMVDFWAAWCGPCKQIAPDVEELAVEYEGQAVVGKVNVDEQGALAQRYGVSGIPALLFFKNGELVDQVVGAAPKSTLASRLSELTKS